MALGPLSAQHPPALPSLYALPSLPGPFIRSTHAPPIPPAAVTRALAESVRALASRFAEPSARGGAGGEAGSEGDATSAQAQALRHRMEVLPALLHLAARAALDNAVEN